MPPVIGHLRLKVAYVWLVSFQSKVVCIYKKVKPNINTADIATKMFVGLELQSNGWLSEVVG